MLSLPGGMLETTTGYFNKEEAVAAIRQRIGDPPVPYGTSGLLLQDREFVFRGDHRHPCHDALGYKNLEVPESCQVLILGNSQVHNTYDKPKCTWPYMLMKQAGVKVYSGAMGSYSVVQYLFALDELLFLAPGDVVMTIYPGNNIVNGLATLRKSVSRLVSEFGPVPDLTLEKTYEAEIVGAFGALSSHEKALLISQGGVQDLPGMGLAVLEGKRYILIPEVRRQNIDLRRPICKFGLAVIFRALALFKRRAEKHGFRPHVMFMPNKEFVFFSRAARVKDVEVFGAKDLGGLGSAEATVCGILGEAARKEGIDFWDLTPTLADALTRGVYAPDTQDGHLALEGRRLVAKFVAARLGKAPSVPS